MKNKGVDLRDARISWNNLSATGTQRTKAVDSTIALELAKERKTNIAKEG
jgi:hypothetical protein